MNHYCLFCQTQRAAKVQKILETIWHYQVIYPQAKQRHWKHGKAEEVVYTCLPGYLFLYSEEPITDFLSLRSIDGVVRQLGNMDDGFRLTGSDLAFSKMMLACHGVIGAQKVYEVEDRIRLCEGLLSGMSGKIRAVDRQYTRMLVTFEFDGQERKIWLGYDVTAKIEERGQQAMAESAEDA